MRRSFYVVAVLVVGLGAFAYWWASSPGTGSKPQSLDRTPTSIDVSVMDRPLTTITNAAGIASVMKMLRSGRGVPRHECKSRGTMVLHFTDAQPLSVGFHPGHHFLRYEFATRGGISEN